jgi:hypothetical protein
MFARSAAGRKLLMQVAAIWPAGMRLAASLTRVPQKALSEEDLLF